MAETSLMPCVMVMTEPEMEWEGRTVTGHSTHQYILLDFITGIPTPAFSPFSFSQYLKADILLGSRLTLLLPIIIKYLGRNRINISLNSG